MNPNHFRGNCHICLEIINENSNHLHCEICKSNIHVSCLMYSEIDIDLRYLHILNII